MKLYANAPIEVLDEIIKDGLQPMSITGNNNWAEGKRADNSKDLVYLFSPISNRNYFPKYGLVLLEIEIEEVEEVEFSANDKNTRNYREFTAKEVPPALIKRIIIPSFLKDRVSQDYDLPLEITWIDTKSLSWDEELDELSETSEEIYKKFADTAEIEIGFNYFRGENEDGTIIDLENIELDI